MSGTGAKRTFARTCFKLPAQIFRLEAFRPVQDRAVEREGGGRTRLTDSHQGLTHGGLGAAKSLTTQGFYARNLGSSPPGTARAAHIAKCCRERLSPSIPSA